MFFLFCFLLIRLTNSFNFDINTPIIKQVNKDVYFGYSIAQHIVKNTKTPYVLVGAPLDTLEFKGVKFNRSGSIYKCPISFDLNDCEQIPVDFLTKNSDETTDGNVFLDDDLSEQFKGRLFENQWLGVTLSSSIEGAFSACAHKYVHYYNFTSRDAHAAYGACYRFNNDFTQEYKHVPCLKYSHSVKIFYSNNYAFCQAGTSLSILEDSSLLSSNQVDTYLSFGMPGALNSRGLVSVKTIGKNSQNEYVYKNKSYCKFDIETDRPMIDGYCPNLWDKYSYTGMSNVIVRKYLNNPRVNLIAAGAPREGLYGLVRLFNITFDSSFGPVTKLLSFTLKGDQKGAYFGFSMVTCDINGDKFDDLIVSAPYYSRKNEPNSGSVYVYLNHKTKGFSEKYSLNFTGLSRSLFGHSIACLGDIDKDGYADFAVGAPYEKFSKNTGAVYIYKGNRDLKKVKLSQKITSESFDDLQTFGYSLSGGVDMDGNTYPDLSVGALNSNKIVLLRTRPVVKIEASLSNKENLNEIDQSVKECVHDGVSLTCFNFEICFKVVNSSVKDLPLLNYTLEADVSNASISYSRVFFTGTNSNFVTKSIPVGTDRTSCDYINVNIKKDNNDFVRPIKFMLKYKFVERSDTVNVLENINKIPMVHDESNMYEFEANFKKDCGSDNKCITDLNLNAYFVDLLISEDNVPLLSFKERDSVTIAVILENIGPNAEPAYATQIDIDFDQRLDFIKKTETKSSGFSCEIQFKKLVCKLTNDIQGVPFGANNIARFNLTFSSTRLYRYPNISSQPNIMFNLEAKTLSHDPNINNNQVDLLAVLKVRANLYLYGTRTPEQVFYSDKSIVRGESSIQSLEQIGPIIEHTYIINNGGPFSVHNFHLVIDWPYESRLVDFDAENNLQFLSGKHLLYLTEKPTKIPNNHPINVVCSSYQVDSLKISDLKTIKKRSVYEDSVIKSPLKEEPSSRTAVIDCFSNSAYCYKINCTFSGEFSKDETISLKLTARLWNSTLVEDYANYEKVLIKSNGRLFLGEDVHDDRPNDNEISVATYAYSRITFRIEKKQPLWIYFMSVLIGLFLFCLSIVGFYMLGFFERKKFGDDKYLEENDKVKKTPY